MLSFIQDGLAQLREAQRRAVIVAETATLPTAVPVIAAIARANGAGHDASSQPQ